MHAMFFDALAAHRMKGARADVQRELRVLYAARGERCQQ
jgi:hypothetical protein